MKCALIRRGFSATGGAEAYLRRFAGAMAASGDEPVLYTDRLWPAESWSFQQQRVGGFGSPGRFAEAVTRARLGDVADLVFSMERVDQCDIYRAGDGVHAAWLERRSQFEPWWRSAFRSLSGKHRTLCLLENQMLSNRGAGRVIANSAMVKNEIVERFGYPAELIDVVHNGVPSPPSAETLASFRHEVRTELQVAPDACVALFAGSGWDRKGLRFAMAAAELASVVGLELWVAGSGRRRGLPGSPATRFLGPVKGLVRYLAAADVFILPTIYDPFSNACLEAFAAGLPVITTKANGFAEILLPGEGTVVDRADSVAELAEALKSWADRSAREALRPRLWTRVKEYSVEANLRATMASIRAVLQEAPSISALAADPFSSPAASR